MGRYFYVAQDSVLLADSFFFSVAVFEEAGCHVVTGPMERVTWQGTMGGLWLLTYRKKSAPSVLQL